MINLCSQNSCTGCGACYNACVHRSINMIPRQPEGFLYPSIDYGKCVGCGLCRVSCPILTPPRQNKEPEVYAAWNNDDNIRQTSSSGGMFYSLAKDIIDVDGAVYGVEILKDGTVCHCRAASLSGLCPMKGSKYVQSDTLNSYSSALKDLRSGMKVMFTGTPCQVAAFRSFLGKRHFDNLLLVDIVCHGVPSNKLFKDYLKKLDSEWNTIHDKSSFVFRELDAWGYAPSVKLSDGIRHRIPQDKDVYMRHFLASYTFRESCYDCKFATTPRYSDITIADFWGIGTKIPFAEDTKKGCSLVLINSEAGKAALDGIENLFLEKRTLAEATAINHQLYSPSIRPRQRDNSYPFFLTHTIKDIYRHYYNSPYLRLRHLGGKIFCFFRHLK